MSPTASSSASANAPTVEMVLRMPSIECGSRLTTVVSPSMRPDRVGRPRGSSPRTRRRAPG